MQPSLEFITEGLRLRRLPDVAPETIEELVGAVADLWELSAQVQNDLAALTTPTTKGDPGV